MEILPVYKDSFFAGFERPDGLQLAMLYEDDTVFCKMDVTTRFEGYRGVVHGGIVFGILDVIIWYAIFMATKKISMTRKTEVEFFKPVLCGGHYVAKGRFVGVKDRDIFAEAWVEDEKGEVCARTKALFREAKDLSVASFMENFDFSRTTPRVREYFYSLVEENRDGSRER